MKIIEIIVKGIFLIPVAILAGIGIIIGFIEVFIGLGRIGIKESVMSQIEKNEAAKRLINKDGNIRQKDDSQGDSED